VIERPPGSGPRIAETALLNDGVTGTAEIAAFSPDGQRLLAGCEDKTMRLCGRQSNGIIRRFGGHGGLPRFGGWPFPVRGLCQCFPSRKP